MKFNKVLFYCVSLSYIIVIKKNRVNSLPTSGIIKRDDDRRIMITKIDNINSNDNDVIIKIDNNNFPKSLNNNLNDEFETHKDEKIIEEDTGINLINNNKTKINTGERKNNNENIEIEEINTNIKNSNQTENININENNNENVEIENIENNSKSNTKEISNKNEPEENNNNNNNNKEKSTANTNNKSKGSIKEFFDKTKDTVIDIYVTMPKEEYLNMTKLSQCVDYRKAKDFSTENASAQFEFNGEVVYLSKIKLSLGGASSRSFQKVGYNIKTLNKEETLYGLRNIKLRGDDRDPTHMVSRLSADFIKSAGLIAPSINYSRLYINDEYMGLYTFQDVIKKYWIKEFFGEKDTKNCFKCETIGFNFDSFRNSKHPVTCSNLNDDYADYTQPFDEFIKKVNSAKSVQDLEEIMDIDVFLKYIAFEWIVLSWDHMLIYGHNFYWYLREDGKWIPIYFDFDLTWYISDRVNLINKTLDKKEKPKFPDDDHVFWPNMSLKDWEPGHRIIDILIHQDDTKFREIVHEMVKNYYNPNYLNNKINDLHSMLKEYIIEDLMFIKDLRVKSAFKLDNSENEVKSNDNLSNYEELFSIQDLGDLEDEKLKLTGSTYSNFDEGVAISNASSDDTKMAMKSSMDESLGDIKEFAGTYLNMNQRGRINLYGLNFSWSYDNYYEVINGENYLINTEGGSRSAPLKWTIKHRFNYLCHTYGINPETLELITPRPDVREWSSTNIYKLRALYDNSNIVRFNYPYLEKEDFNTNYCKYCEINEENDHGEMFGLENNETCIIHLVECGIEKGVEMGPNGYPYCSKCKVYDIKGGVLLGLENNVLCEIQTINC